VVAQRLSKETLTVGLYGSGEASAQSSFGAPHAMLPQKVPVPKKCPDALAHAATVVAEQAPSQWQHAPRQKSSHFVAIP
jgi:hypothetical protein